MENGGGCGGVGRCTRENIDAPYAMLIRAHGMDEGGRNLILLLSGLNARICSKKSVKCW
jgi:hypothetical protein